MRSQGGLRKNIYEDFYPVNNIKKLLKYIYRLYQIIIINCYYCSDYARRKSDTEMSSEEADEHKGERVYNGASLNAPEHWEHKQYRLTMIMLDTFDCEEDDMNVLAMTIYRRMRSENCTPDDIIYGTVYIGNENANEVIDFTTEGLTYICKQVLKNPNSKMT